MNVYEAVDSRRSVRAFLPDAIDGAVIRRVVERAARAASGGNIQPWRIDVVGGKRLNELREIMRRLVVEEPGGEPMEYTIYPPNLPAPWRNYRFQVGEALYASVGIPREDKAGRAAWFARNFQFFDAPAALFCSVARVMGPPQWSDMGMYLQNVMLLLRAEGLDSCPQECWAMYSKTMRDFLQIPEDHMLFTGMAIGKRDAAHPVNQFPVPRAPLEAFARFHDI